MTLVQTEVVGNVLLIEIQNPPINAASLGVRQGVQEAIRLLADTPGLRAGVIIGGGTTFIAGSDLREFGKPLDDPQLPAVLADIEACPKPVVAALHGAALGGGLELALACDARIALAGTVIGLPEVTLGIIPGAGGTQRVPRRIGLARAIQMVCSGERIKAEVAHELGLVDQVVSADLAQHAIALASSLHSKRWMSQETVPAEDAAQVEQAAQQALKAGKHRPAVQAAIEAVKDAARLAFAEGLAKERAVFQSLRQSPEAHALRHLFFAERSAGRLPPELDGSPRDVKTIAVIGAGTMGAGIAICALDAGFSVVLLEQTQEALQRGQDRITDHYRARVVSGKLKASLASSHESRLDATTDWSRVSQADLVIEAVFEDLDVKQDVFRKIDAHARSGAVLATNTSYLDIDAIASVTSRPQDVLGLHFFSPAQVMRLLEVVRGARTGADVLATGMWLGQKLRKSAVPCANSFGFIGNRIYNAYRMQCEFMLEDGAWPEDVDNALTALGLAMGPFAVADLSGLDIAWRMRKSQAATRDPNHRYVDILDKLCEAGRLGRKAGAGYYRYADGRQEKTSDAFVRTVIEEASARRGIARRPLSPAMIQRRALLAMVNEAALLLQEGVAARASDIDVVMVQGYGFPRWEGGPVFWAARQPREELEDQLASLVAASGPGVRKAGAAALDRLLERAQP